MDSGSAVQRPDWYATSGARALRASSPIAYCDYVRYSSDSRHHTPALEDDRRQIELDLPRTGVSICEFILRVAVPDDDSNSSSDDDGDNNDRTSALIAPFLPMLRNILLAYSVRNPRVGYVQGHADVVCFLIGNINARRDEEEVFWVYASIIERVFPDDFFARAPKLHGFQVADLTFVTSLLSCKWFVSMWVGYLPVDVLCRVWDVMLGDDDGATLHLLLGLHFFQAAVDSVMAHMATDDWDSSYLYQIILKSSQSAPLELDPHEVLRHGHSTYGLNDEAIEDMRSTLRLDPQLQRLELAELARQSAFTLAELEQLHEEFTFVRFHTKAYERVKLRGVRQEYIESLVAREFATWPVDICPRLFQLMKPDGFGNVSFASLIQLLSVLARGDHDAKTTLLFAIPDVQERGFLDRAGANQLADLLCCLFANKALANTSLQPLEGAERDALLRKNTEQSPLLRSQFRKKLEPLVSEQQTLEWVAWKDLARRDTDILSLMEWDVLERQSKSSSSSRQEQQHKFHRSSAKTVTMARHDTASARLSPSLYKHHERNDGGENRHPNNSSSDDVDWPTELEGAKKNGRVSSPPLGLESASSARRRVRLLSAQMESKFKLSRALITGDGLRRNPFETQLAGGSAGGINHAQMYWCQCALS